MASEIQWRGTETGVTLYATIRSKTGTQWNTAGTPNFEAVTTANWADYDISLVEGDTASNYFYVGTFPAISGNMVAGWYWVDIYKRAGVAPAITDVLQGTIIGYWNGTTFGPWAANAQEINGVSAASVTAVNANVGTTQPVNFHGTGATAYVKSDIIEINDVAASAATEINANLTKIIGTALTEAIAGQLAAAFKKFFDVTTPTGSVNSLPNAVPDAAGGLPISDAGGVDVDAMKTTIAKVETLIGTV